MKTVRTYRYRIYPSREQETDLHMSLCECKDLWNSLLQHTKEFYGKTGKFPSRYTLVKLTKGKGTKLYSQSAQNTADRLYGSIKGAMARKKKGLKIGFPRFKPIERVKSFTYPQSGFRLESKLHLSRIGAIQIKKHRELTGTIKTLTIKRMPTGKWYALFAVELELAAESQPPNSNLPVGVDLGIENFATMSDNKTIGNPRHLKNAKEKLKNAQRNLSRKKKGGKNRIKAKLRVARAYEAVVDGRRDFLHKASRKLADSYSLIAMEDLNVKGLSKGFLAKHVLDCSWAEFRGMLHYKAEEAGSEVILVNPTYTSQECSNCGLIRKKKLAERQHNCPCGTNMHRDLNAAKNILKKATSGRWEARSFRPETPVEKGPLPERVSSADESGNSVREAGSPTL